MKTKFGKRIEQFFNNIKQIKADKKIRKDFINDIKHEIQDPRSKFNALHLSTDENYNSITTILSLPESFQLSGSDIMKYQKLQELARPINLYIGKDLNYGEYFKSPEFFYIDNVGDINDEGNEILEEVSCSYVAEWKYEPVLNKYPNFKWELTAFVGINALLLGSLITLLIILL